MFEHDPWPMRLITHLRSSPRNLVQANNNGEAKRQAQPHASRHCYKVHGRVFYYRPHAVNARYGFVVSRRLRILSYRTANGNRKEPSDIKVLDVRWRRPVTVLGLFDFRSMCFRTAFASRQLQERRECRRVCDIYWIHLPWIQEPSFRCQMYSAPFRTEVETKTGRKLPGTH